MRNFANRFSKRIRLAKAKRVQAPKHNNRRNANRISFESLESRQLLAWTTSYSLDFEQVTPLNNTGDSETSATSLVNNGFAVSASHAGHIDTSIFKTNLTSGGGSSNLTGTNSSIDQLANKNLVIVGQDADSIWYNITSSAGTLITAADIGNAGCTDADVAGLTGGRFVVVAEDFVAGPNTNIHIFIRNSDGSEVTSFVADFTSKRDLKPSVAALDDGNFAVAWHRETAGTTVVWYAVYDADGNSVATPQNANAVSTVNQNVDVSPKANGFVIVYEDNGWGSGTNDITLAEYDLFGNWQSTNNVSNPPNTNDSSNDANPRVARLSNNLLVVGWENNFLADTDNLIGLYDPAIDLRLATANIAGGESISDDVGDMSIAGSFNARVNVFQTNFTDSAADGETRIAKRFSVGDAANDVITGDELVDVMNGNAGNDTLSGGLSNDTLNGGADDDTLNGDEGNDILIGLTGVDTMNGGAGSDAAFYAASPEAVYIDLLFDVVMGGHADGDILTDIERLTGSAFDDTLYGGNADNTLIGGAGADYLGGDDGNDTLKGDDGVDTLWGANGVDTLRGGNDADIFQYFEVGESGPGGANRDRIVDFNQAQFDVIDVSNIDGKTSDPFSTSFTYIGNAAFTGEGQIRAFQVGASTVIRFNTTGNNAAAEMEIVLRNFTAANLTQNDFLVGASFVGWYGDDGSSDGSSDGPGFSSMSAGFGDSVSGPQFAAVSNQAGSYTLVTKPEAMVGKNRPTGVTDSQDSTTLQDLVVLDSVFAVLGS